jgi:hypothetical protein
MDQPEDDHPSSLSDDSTHLSVSDRRDIAIINRNADLLNREAMDVLEYQQYPLTFRSGGTRKASR